MEAALVVATEEELRAVCRGWQSPKVYDPPLSVELTSPLLGVRRCVKRFEKPTRFPDDVAWYARILDKLPRVELDWLYEGGVAFEPTFLRVVGPLVMQVDAAAIERWFAPHLVGPRCASVETELVYRLAPELGRAIAALSGEALARAVAVAEEAGYPGGAEILPRLGAAFTAAFSRGADLFAVFDWAGDTSPPDNADPRDPDWGRSPIDPRSGSALN